MVAVRSLSGKAGTQWEEDEDGNLVKAKDKSKQPKQNRRPSQALIHVHADGSEFHYSKRSCFLLEEDSFLRSKCIEIVHWPWFDRIIILFIALNSLMLALTDYDTINMNRNADNYGEPIAKGSRLNTLSENLEPMFTGVFTLECILKITAMGFSGNTDSYINDRWNMLDFVVVVTSLIAGVPGMPNVSALRTFRVLRPLRAMSSIPELQNIVETMLKSMPELGNVVIVLCFIFALFGIVGMQLFMGRQHFRCRLTPHPVILDWSPDLNDALNYSKYKCLDVSNFNLVTEDETWEKADSPWATKQPCYWPVASDDFRVCDPSVDDYQDGKHEHQCLHQDIGAKNYTWCGSDYDARGNSRFQKQTMRYFVDDDLLSDAGVISVKLDSSEVAKSATYHAKSNYGYPNFDNFATSFLTIFQCITMEGWSEIMYQLMDGYSAVGAAAFFATLVLFGSLFALNLLLAVMEGQFHLQKEEQEERKKEEAKLKKKVAEDDAKERGETALAIAVRDGDIDGMANPVANGGTPRNYGRGPTGLVSPMALEYDNWNDKEIKRKSWRERSLQCHHLVYEVATAPWFGSVITFLIVCNTIILSMDHYEMDTRLAEGLEIANFVLTMSFTLEMVLKLVALGPRGYCKEAFNIFDGVIVVTSLIEMILLPPPILTGTTPNDGATSGGGVISVLRSFRLFRVFKLAREWDSMRILLLKVAVTCVDMGFFILLLLLYMFIFALIGCQFFANRLHFDEDGYVIPIGEPGWEDAEIPMTHFDTIGHSLVAVFQILTGENWPVVMYDCWRATGWLSVIYFVVVVITGMFMVMNLCIAIILGDLCVDHTQLEQKMESEISNLLDEGNAGLIESIDDLIGGLHLAGQESGPADAMDASGHGSKEISVQAVQLQMERRNSNGGLVRMGSSENEFSSLMEINKQKNNGTNNGSANGVDKPKRPSLLLPGEDGSHRMSRKLMKNPLGGTGPPSPSPRNEDEEELTTADLAALKDHFQKADADRSGDIDLTEAFKLFEDIMLKGNHTPPPPHILHELFNDADKDHGGSLDFEEFAELFRKIKTSVKSKLDQKLEQEMLSHGVFPLEKGRTLGLFSHTNRFRIFCAHVVSHPKFDTIVLVFIIISSCLLALDNPLLHPESIRKMILIYADYAFTGLFTCELLLKIISIGFVCGKDAYLKDSWNVLDGTVVMISWISIFANDIDALKSLKSFRSLRALRPLRVVKRFPGLKVVVNAMFAAITDVLNVSAVCLLFFLIFSIFFVNFFKGQLRSCGGSAYDNYISRNGSYTELLTYPKAWDKMSSEEQSWFQTGSAVFSSSEDGWYASCSNSTYACCKVWPKDKSEVPTSQDLCECWGGEWTKVVPQTFDNVAEGMMTLLEMSTTEGWVDVVWAVVAANGARMEPIRDNNFFWALFFVLFMLLGSYLILNLFVGVVVDNFNSVRKDAEGDVSLLTEAQRAWIKTQQTAAKFKPKKKLFPPVYTLGRFKLNLLTQFGQWCFRNVVNVKKFEWGIMTCIILNTIVMAMVFFGMDEEYEAILDYCNYFFALVFTVEAIMKIAAMQRHYFSEAWNRFDFAIVLGTACGMIALWVTGSGTGSIVTIVRSFRVGRIFRLIQGAKGLNRLFNTMILTLPGLSNISALLMLLLFIFSVMSLQLFATIQYHGALDENTNFRQFPRALLILFRACTGENWNGLMHDMTYRAEGCVESSAMEYNPDMCGYSDHPGCIPLNGCGSSAAIPFLLLFTFVVSFVFINLFIGVILEGFDLANEGFGVSDEDFVKFQEHWSDFDPNATYYIPVADLPRFVETLHKPLGFGCKGNATVDEKKLKKKLADLNIEEYKEKDKDPKVHFKDVLTGVANDVVKMDLEFREKERVARRASSLAIEEGEEGGMDEAKEGDEESPLVTRKNSWSLGSISPVGSNSEDALANGDGQGVKEGADGTPVTSPGRRLHIAAGAVMALGIAAVSSGAI